VANSPIDRLQVRWFDYFLKGIDTGLIADAPVQLFEIGSNRWRKFQEFPDSDAIAYRIQSSELHRIGETDNALLEDTSPIQNPKSKIQNFNVTSAAPDILVHDPWRPVPALGGHATMPAGAYDRSSLDCRTDILTYTSAALSEDLHLAGEAIARLYCTADAVSFDLCVILSEVKPNGMVYNFTQGYVRVPTHAPPNTLPMDEVNCAIAITFQPISICLAKGSAIRLSISAACFPAYAVNAGTGAFSADAQLLEAKVMTLTLKGSEENLHLTKQSQILLPVLTKKQFLSN
jgi:uncharacterized protein